jgi:hypothetical protein
MTKNLSLLAAGVIALGLVSSPALAVGTVSRTFVSGSPPGSDAGTCPITAPCRTFAYALTQTAPSGEIIVLSSGGYGAVTIGQAVSIINTSDFAGVTVASGTGITINAGTNDSVTLGGLTIDGGGAGANGVVFNSGSKLTIDQCNVMNFSGSGITGNGILMQPSTGTSQVIIKNTGVTNNQIGVSLVLAGTASAGIVIDHVTANNNNTGINLSNNGSSGSGSASIANTVASANANIGFGLSSFFTSLDLSYAIGNQIDGIHIDKGTLMLGRSVVMSNGTGLTIKGAGVASYQDNRFGGNGDDIFGGTPTTATLH